MLWNKIWEHFGSLDLTEHNDKRQTIIPDKTLFYIYIFYTNLNITWSKDIKKIHVTKFS